MDTIIEGNMKIFSQRIVEIWTGFEKWYIEPYTPNITSAKHMNLTRDGGAEYLSNKLVLI